MERSFEVPKGGPKLWQVLHTLHSTLKAKHPEPFSQNPKDSATWLYALLVATSGPWAAAWALPRFGETLALKLALMATEGFRFRAPFFCQQQCCFVHSRAVHVLA